MQEFFIDLAEQTINGTLTTDIRHVGAASMMHCGVVGDGERQAGEHWHHHAKGNDTDLCDTNIPTWIQRSWATRG